jgi:hypothetical protein
MANAENSISSSSAADVESQNGEMVVTRTSMVQWIRENPRKAAGIAFGGVAVLGTIIGLAVGLHGAKAANAASTSSFGSSGSTVSATPAADYSGDVSFTVSCATSGSTVTVSSLPSDATCVIRTDTFERAVVSNGEVTFAGVTDVSALTLELYTAESGEFDCTGAIGEAQCSV